MYTEKLDVGKSQSAQLTVNSLPLSSHVAMDFAYRITELITQATHVSS